MTVSLVFTLELLSTLCVSFFVFYVLIYFIYVFIIDNISISMFIMCVILCLFSALSRWVGALQISIIIITILRVERSPRTSCSSRPSPSLIRLMVFVDFKAPCLLTDYQLETDADVEGHFDQMLKHCTSPSQCAQARTI